MTIKSAHADLRLTGSFSCSNPFLNHVYDATLRTHLNYTLDIPMDPTREKAGWLQDVQTMVDSTVYLTDMDASLSPLVDRHAGVAIARWFGWLGCADDLGRSGKLLE